MMRDLARQIDKKDERIKELTKQLDQLKFNLDMGEAQAEDLKKQIKLKDKWGKEMAKRMKQINTLTWVKDIERSLPKD